MANMHLERTTQNKKKVEMQMRLHFLFGSLYFLDALTTAWAAANLAIGTLNGEQDT